MNIGISHRPSAMPASRFATDGFEMVPAVIDPGTCDDILASLERSKGLVSSRGLLRLPWCARLASRLTQGVLADRWATDHVAVQCTLFEKSGARNWLVPIHQDLGIPVRKRVEHPALRGWSSKGEDLFVQPPISILEQVVAVRIHLDPCTLEDGPLDVVPGSHLQGRIDPATAAGLRSRHAVACLADRGDALVMRPLLLHASSKSTGSRPRRVLHFVFGPRSLSHGLQWPFTA